MNIGEYLNRKYPNLNNKNRDRTNYGQTKTGVPHRPMWKDRALNAEAKLETREDDVEEMLAQLQASKTKISDLQRTIDRIKDTLQII